MAVLGRDVVEVWKVDDDVNCVVPVLGGPHATGTTHVACVVAKKRGDADTPERPVGLGDTDAHNFAMHALMHNTRGVHSCGAKLADLEES